MLKSQSTAVFTLFHAGDPRGIFDPCGVKADSTFYKREFHPFPGGERPRTSQQLNIPDHYRLQPLREQGVMGTVRRFQAH
jgi:hypothetical protein